MLKRVFYSPYLQLSTVDKLKQEAHSVIQPRLQKELLGTWYMVPSNPLHGWRAGDTQRNDLKSSCHQFPSPNPLLGKSEYFSHFHFFTLSCYITSPSICPCPFPLSAQENQHCWGMVYTTPWRITGSPACSRAHFTYTQHWFYSYTTVSNWVTSVISVELTHKHRVLSRAGSSQCSVEELEMPEWTLRHLLTPYRVEGAAQPSHFKPDCSPKF